MKEIWKDIVGYENLYKISNSGRIKSNHKNGCYFKNEDRILTPVLNELGYYIVFLCKNKVKTRFRIHRLVAMAFIHNPNNKPFINHINAIPNDNRVENLEWCTQSENLKHAAALGRMKPPINFRDNTKRCKIKTTDIKYIAEEFKNGKKSRELAEKYGVCKETIYNIIKNL